MSRSIAIWQTAFLGDAVLTLPVIHNVARAYPEADIHFYVREGLEDLFRPHKEFAAVHGVAKRGRHAGLAGARRLAEDMAKRKHDLLISAHASFRSALVAALSKIPRRIGYSAPLYNRLAYTETIPRRFNELEEIERLLQLLIPLDIPPEIHWPRPALAPQAEAEAKQLRQRINRPLVGIHPGSVWPTKRWPAAHFSRLLDMAVAEGAAVAVFAGPGEEATAREVLNGAREGAGNQVVDLAGKLSLPELAAHLGILDAYVTNDSGPMHLAWSQHTPLVALFGPTVRELGFFPRGETSVILETGVDCRPCGLHGGHRCKHRHHRCMMEITPEAAWGAARKLLESRHGHPS